MIGRGKDSASTGRSRGGWSGDQERSDLGSPARTVVPSPRWNGRFLVALVLTLDSAAPVRTLNTSAPRWLLPAWLACQRAELLPADHWPPPRSPLPLPLLPQQLRNRVGAADDAAAAAYDRHSSSIAWRRHGHTVTTPTCFLRLGVEHVLRLAGACKCRRLPVAQMRPKAGLVDTWRSRRVQRRP